jgi:hypothetical protein
MCRNYRRQAERFMNWISKPLTAIRLGDLQASLQTLEGQVRATRAAATAALKSLFMFVQETCFPALQRRQAKFLYKVSREYLSNEPKLYPLKAPHPATQPEIEKRAPLPDALKVR